MSSTAAPPQGYEPWIESYSFEDIVPIPILPTLNATGWAIPKRVFDAYCHTTTAPTTTIDEHMAKLKSIEDEDDKSRAKRHDNKQKAQQTAKNEEADTKEVSRNLRRSPRLNSTTACWWLRATGRISWLTIAELSHALTTVIEKTLDPL